MKKRRRWASAVLVSGALAFPFLFPGLRRHELQIILRSGPGVASARLALGREDGPVTHRLSVVLDGRAAAPWVVSLPAGSVVLGGEAGCADGTRRLGERPIELSGDTRIFVDLDRACR